MAFNFLLICEKCLAVLGYEYDYPFLDKSCGLVIDKHSVIPLHKYMVNINEPSMVIMGLVIRACLVVAIDAQVIITYIYVHKINCNVTFYHYSCVCLVFRPVTQLP